MSDQLAGVATSLEGLSAAVLESTTPVVQEPYAKEPALVANASAQSLELNSEDEAKWKAEASSYKAMMSNLVIEMLDEKMAEAKAAEWKKDNFTNCEVSSAKVIEVLTGFVQVSRLVVDDATIDSAIKKLSNWIETTPGGNDEEAAQLYLLQEILKVLNDEQNAKISELNVLMLRLALFNMKDHKTGEAVFAFWEVMMLTMASLNQDEMN